MNTPTVNAPAPASGDPLDRRAPVWGVLVVAFVLLGWGEARITAPYTSTAFVIDYFWTELQVTALLLLATALWWPRRRLGLRLPQAASWRHVGPLVLLVGVSLSVWALAVLQVPDANRPDAATSAQVLRTTLLVGLNEEWLFRGLALAAFCHWWGWRRGWLAALLAFACLHLLNLIGGIPPAGAAFQFVNTFLMGSVFVLAAVHLRSLLVPMLVHALYDWSVIDTQRHIAAGVSQVPTLVLTVLALLLGLYSLWTLWHLSERVPYAEGA